MDIKILDWVGANSPKRFYFGFNVVKTEGTSDHINDIKKSKNLIKV